ncbi:MAG: hypothetical protein V6Z89_01410 [Desulfobacter sp.]
MITITLRLSESLLCIFRDSGQPRKETVDVRVTPGTTVRDILAGQGINPLLVPMAGLSPPMSGTRGNTQKRVGMDTALDSDGILTLYGPLAGG